MPLSAEDRKKLTDNNRQISKLLEDNEVLLRKAGFNPPVLNFALSDPEKIKIPSRYIRTVESFLKKYHLIEIVPNHITRHNITYALEVSDLINYIINRINIWGSVEAVFYKLAIVNFVSIIEAIILEAANNICCQASSCGKTMDCDIHFSNSERNNAGSAVEKLVSIGVLDFNRQKIVRIKEIISLRNRIHIRLSETNELKSEDFNVRLYNEVVELLQSINDQIYRKAVPLYGCRTEQY